MDPLNLKAFADEPSHGQLDGGSRNELPLLSHTDLMSIWDQEESTMISSSHQNGPLFFNPCSFNQNLLQYPVLEPQQFSNGDDMFLLNLQSQFALYERTLYQPTTPSPQILFEEWTPQSEPVMHQNYQHQSYHHEAQAMQLNNNALFSNNRNTANPFFLNREPIHEPRIKKRKERLEDSDEECGQSGAKSDDEYDDQRAQRSHTDSRKLQSRKENVDLTSCEIPPLDATSLQYDSIFFSFCEY